MREDEFRVWMVLNDGKIRIRYFERDRRDPRKISLRVRRERI
jgi:hypothetical protein